MLPPSRKMVQPAVTDDAMSQSVTAYFFPFTAMPQPMTGTILELFPSICTGNETNFSASYWQVVAQTLEMLIAAYFHIGGTDLTDSPFTSTIMKAKQADTRRFCKTM